MKKLKYFKNVANNAADFYVYGAIEDEKDEYWSGENAIDPNDLKEELDELKANGVRDLNILINSPGGSVFAASTIVSQLQRAKQGGLKIHAFIDGLCASAATFLAMVADEINVYKNSIFMVHKPWTFSIGNADELRKDIETLDTLENNVMLPLYKEKAKVDEAELKKLVADETWFNGNEEDELYIGNFFNVVQNSAAKTVAACADRKAFKNYKHVPEALKNLVKETAEPVENGEEKPAEAQEDTVEKPVENVDLSAFYDTIKSLKH